MTIKTQKASNANNSDRTDMAPLSISGLDYAVIFNAASNGMAFTERNSGRILDVNAAWTRFAGIAREKAIGKTAFELGIWASQAERESCLAKLDKNGRIVDHEVTLIMKSAERPHLISAEFAEMNGKQCILWEFRDITEQKRTNEDLVKNEEKIRSLLAASEQSRRTLLSILEDEKLAKEALRESEEKYRTVVETTDTGFVALDEQGRVSNANLNYAHMLGYSSVDKIIGRQVTEWTAPYDLERNRIEISKCFNNGSVRNLEIDYKRTDGAIVPIEINATTLHTKNGKIILTICRDITKRKRVEEALHQSLSLLNATLESTADGILVIDRDGKVVGLNQKFLQLWHIPQSVSDSNDDKILLSFVLDQLRDPKAFLAKVDQLYAEPDARSEDIVEFNDGRIFERYSQPQKLGEIIVGRVWCFRDVTERKQVEQKILEYQKHLKRLAAKLTLAEEEERRRIAGEIHDEISQTLAMAKIKLDSLRSSPPSEASAAVIEEISVSVEKVIQETRTLTFELSNPILYELGFEAAVAEWLDERVQVKFGIATEFYDDELPKPLDDDLKAMLFRNTRELLTNCIKHANAGKIRVSIRRIDDSIEVAVEDNGVGFEPTEVRSTASKKAKFGLFSIRESLENLGGYFKIDSKPGAGCKAVMTAPLKDQSNMKEV